MPFFTIFAAVTGDVCKLAKESRNGKMKQWGNIRGKGKNEWGNLPRGYNYAT